MYSHLIANSAIPTAVETEQITKLLEHTLSESERLDKLIDELVRQREELNERVTQYRSMLSPIRRVPRDILAQVFLCCLPEKHNAIMSSQEAPLLLGRICSLWRTVSQSLPGLWSGIHIVLPHISSEDKHELVADAVCTWLGRSGILPLSISIHSNREYAFKGSQRLNIINALLNFKHRWYKFDCSLLSRAMTPIWEIAADQVPMLHSISLTQPLYPLSYITGPGFIAPESQVDWSTMTLFRAPNLRDLSLPPQSLTQQVLVNTVAFGQLTSLNLRLCRTSGLGRDHHLPLALILSILRRCPQLQSCSFHIQRSEVIPAETVHLPALHTLDIHQSEHPDGSPELDIFAILITPSLQHLTYGIPPPADFTGKDFEHAFDLKSLSFIYCPLSLPNLVAYLSKNPNLETLEVQSQFPTSWSQHEGCGVDDAFIESLIVNDSEDVLLPRLRSLRLSTEDIKELDPELALKMLRSRSPGSTRSCSLRHSSLPFPCPASDEYVKAIEGLRTDGMGIQFAENAPSVKTETPWDGVKDIIDWNRWKQGQV